MGGCLHRSLLLVKIPDFVRLIDKVAHFVNQRNNRPRCVLGAPFATIRPVYTLLGILQVIISVVLIFLILLHSGKDTGLSGAFGIGGGGSSFGGGSMVERNLDRATVFFAILFVVNTLAILKV
jgi:preprotein translocase subunit SecG